MTSTPEKSRSIPTSADLEEKTMYEKAETKQSNDEKLVTLGEDDPKILSPARKWLVIAIVSSSSLCVTSGSSVAASTESGIQRSFHISHEVSILSISLFIEGLGVGPLLLGPLSEFYGRNAVYAASFTSYFLLGFPVAFANNAPVHLTFRFLCGFAGSAFFSVAGGTVSDLFDDSDVAIPMAVYTLSPFFGPVLGSVIGGFITQHLDWRWTYYILQIWDAFQLLALLALVPETYVPTILQRKARRLRKQTGDMEIYSAMDKMDKGIFESIKVNCYRPFEILISEHMALLLDLWSALLLGILYLTFQAFPVIFGQVHHFNVQSTGLAFLGIGLGMMISLATEPIWNRVFQQEYIKYSGHPPPEVRLYMGMAGAVIVPIGLFWIAFTTYSSVHWIVPILGSIPFGTGMIYVFTSVFTFLVTTYRHNAASALAGNTFMRCTFAAVFPLFAGPMYARLTPPGATALLAGLNLCMMPLPFIFFKYGPQIRRSSKFTEA